MLFDKIIRRFSTGDHQGRPYYTSLPERVNVYGRGDPGGRPYP